MGCFIRLLSNLFNLSKNAIHIEEKLVVELHLLTKNILKKVKKSWKIEQYQKRLASVFVYFLAATVNVLFCEGRVENKLCLPSILRFP